jgi:hypothetical protein
MLVINQGAILEQYAFITHFGRSGAFGALMDEYARAAEDFCRAVEMFNDSRFDSQKPDNSDTTRSPRVLCVHVIGAAHRYAHYIRKRLGIDFVERFEADPTRVRSAKEARPLLAEAIMFTDNTVQPLNEMSEDEVLALSFPVRWGPTYDPEMILEHAICHLLRHRRQLERW